MLALLSMPVLWAQEADGEPTGSLYGLVIAETGGDTLAASVFILETTFFVEAGRDGRYRIGDIPVGTYTVRFFSRGYSVQEVTGVRIAAGEATKVDVALASQVSVTGDFGATEDVNTENIAVLDAFVVTAEQNQSQDVELLNIRQTSLTSINAISSDALSRFAAGDAGEALQKIPGVSVVDGRFPVVRGLNDRYSNVLLNGMKVPSPDPNRQTVQLDLFPSDIIQNIQVSKSFTPDQPGNSAGGSINVTTVDFPPEFLLSFSAGYSFNDRALDSTYVDYDVPGDNWRLANGTEDRLPFPPGLLERTVGSANLTRADYPEYYSADTFYAPERSDDSFGPYGYEFSLEVGGSKTFDNDSVFGVIGVLSYDLGYDFREGFTEDLSRLGPTLPFNETEGRYSYLQSQEEVTITGLLGLSYRFNTEHQLRLDTFYVRTGEDTARYEFGGLIRDGFEASTQNDIFSDDDTEFFEDGNFRLEQFFLLYEQRELITFQLQGDHFFDDLRDLEVDWSVAYSDTSQQEPNFQRFDNYYFDRSLGLYVSPGAQAGGGQFRRSWRDTAEDLFSASSNAELTLFEGLASPTKLKFGAATDHAERTAQQIDTFSTPQNVNASSLSGLIRSFAEGANIASVLATPSLANMKREVSAGYAMFVIPVTLDFEVVVGLRVEHARFDAQGYSVRSASPAVGSASVFRLPINGVRPEVLLSDVLGIKVEGQEIVSDDGTTRMVTRDEADVFTVDTGPARPPGTPESIAVHDDTVAGTLNEVYYLPSLSFNWKPTSNSVLRTSFYKSIAYPSLRELAPYFTTDVESGGDVVLGNPGLEPSEILSADLRFELYYGEQDENLFAVTIFYKEIDQPIERNLIVVDPPSPYREEVFIFANTDAKADLRGFEFEWQQQLVVFADFLNGFRFGLNATLIDAEVPIEISDGVTEERNLFDQPEWILNADLSYAHEDAGFSTTLSLFAISDVLSGPVPANQRSTRLNQYEASHYQLNWTVEQIVNEQWKFKFSVKNLTDTTRGTVYEPNAFLGSVWQDRYHKGRSYSFSANFTF